MKTASFCQYHLTPPGWHCSVPRESFPAGKHHSHQERKIRCATCLSSLPRTHKGPVAAPHPRLTKLKWTETKDRKGKKSKDTSVSHTERVIEVHSNQLCVKIQHFPPVFVPWVLCFLMPAAWAPPPHLPKLRDFTGTPQVQASSIDLLPSLCLALGV